MAGNDKQGKTFSFLKVGLNLLNPKTNAVGKAIAFKNILEGGASIAIHGSDKLAVIKDVQDDIYALVPDSWKGTFKEGELEESIEKSATAWSAGMVAYKAGKELYTAINAVYASVKNWTVPGDQSVGPHQQ